MLYVFFNNSLC